MPRTPLWKTIAQTLTEEIAAGAYAPGAKLPTEAALASRFGVNRHTVRQALKGMAEDGLVRSRRGAGVFVEQLQTEYPLGPRVRFHRNLRAAGRLPDKRYLSIETRSAGAVEARALHLDPGAPVHAAHGLSLADGQPIALFHSVFPAARFSGLPEKLRALRSVTKALAAEGLEDYTRAETRLTAVAASATQALHLGCRENAPILKAQSVNVDGAGLPVECGETWFAGDRVTLTVPGETAGSTPWADGDPA